MAVAGSRLGFPIVDPLIGLLIGITILFIARDAIKRMWYRLMDAVDPKLLTKAETTVQQQPGVRELGRIRMRWIGHRLQAEVVIAVPSELSVAKGHQIAEQVRHDLFHAIPKLDEITIHVDPWERQADEFHELTSHHEAVPEVIQSI